MLKLQVFWHYDLSDLKELLAHRRGCLFREHLSVLHELYRNTRDEAPSCVVGVGVKYGIAHIFHQHHHHRELRKVRLHCMLVQCKVRGRHKTTCDHCQLLHFYADQKKKHYDFSVYICEYNGNIQSRPTVYLRNGCPRADDIIVHSQR
jgi:hypothetical protein